MVFLVPRPWPALVAGLVALSIVPLGAQPAPAGRVKEAIGGVTIVRADEAFAAEVGAIVRESDTLRTGADGRMAVMLKDNTRLALGPNTEIVLSEFVYQPADSRLSLVLKMARGALSYVSGRIAALRPESVRLETPTAVIGVRGTHALIHAEAP